MKLTKEKKKHVVLRKIVPRAICGHFESPYCDACSVVNSALRND